MLQLKKNSCREMTLTFGLQLVLVVRAVYVLNVTSVVFPSECRFFSVVITYNIFPSDC